MTSAAADADTAARDGACDEVCPSRRALLLAGAAGVTVGLTGCETYGEPVVNEPIVAAPSDGAATAPAAGSTDAPAEEPAEEPAEPGGEVLASLGDLPIGGGVVFADKGVVVTHPKEGQVKAFSATCTHAGCKVNEVANGTINCPCHGSKFSVTDGSVESGPAGSGLAAVKVAVDGDNVRLA